MLVGFTRYAGPSDVYYQYIAQGMKNVNNTFLQKGFSVADIHYQDIYYKVENNILAIVFKVVVNSSAYSFQFKGPIKPDSVTTISTTTTTSTISSGLFTQIDNNTISWGGVVYTRVSN